MTSEHYEIVALGQPRLCRNQHKIEYNSSRLGCCTRIALLSYFGLLCKTNMKYKIVTMRSLHFFRFSSFAVLFNAFSLFFRKCEAWSPNPNLDFSALPNAITVRSSGLKNLAAAILTNDDFIQALFLKRVGKCEIFFIFLIHIL